MDSTNVAFPEILKKCRKIIVTKTSQGLNLFGNSARNCYIKVKTKLTLRRNQSQVSAIFVITTRTGGMGCVSQKFYVNLYAKFHAELYSKNLSWYS